MVCTGHIPTSASNLREACIQGMRVRLSEPTQLTVNSLMNHDDGLSSKFEAPVHIPVCRRGSARPSARRVPLSLQGLHVPDRDLDASEQSICERTLQPVSTLRMMLGVLQNIPFSIPKSTVTTADSEDGGGAQASASAGAFFRWPTQARSHHAQI